MQNVLEMGVKSHEASLSVCLCAIDIWSRSSFRVTPCRLPQCWCRLNNWSCTEISPFTDCNKTHFCCKFWIHSLDMKPFYWFRWYEWLKMAFKMSQEFPTASLDIIKFCIICCYYVCFGLLMQISLADYSAYLHELRVSCTLWSILRSVSGWFLNFKSLFSNSVPPLNLSKFSEYCINYQYRLAAEVHVSRV